MFKYFGTLLVGYDVIGWFKYFDTLHLALNHNRKRDLFASLKKQLGDNPHL